MSTSFFDSLQNDISLDIAIFTLLYCRTLTFDGCHRKRITNTRTLQNRNICLLVKKNVTQHCLVVSGLGGNPENLFYNVRMCKYSSALSRRLNVKRMALPSPNRVWQKLSTFENQRNGKFRTNIPRTRIRSPIECSRSNGTKDIRVFLFSRQFSVHSS